ncbi:MAG: hypothetical protein ACLRJ3_15885 [Thomasclavelia ramosa]
MEIWIRSQDKKSLLLCETFDVGCDNDNYNILVNYELRNNEEHYSPIGYYSSVEKAVLVLDMIQEHIETRSNNVFKMPRDIIIIDNDEVEA